MTYTVGPDGFSNNRSGQAQRQATWEVRNGQVGGYGGYGGYGGTGAGQVYYKANGDIDFNRTLSNRWRGAAVDALSPQPYGYQGGYQGGPGGQRYSYGVPGGDYRGGYASRPPEAVNMDTNGWNGIDFKVQPASEMDAQRLNFIAQNGSPRDKFMVGLEAISGGRYDYSAGVSVQGVVSTGRDTMEDAAKFMADQIEQMGPGDLDRTVGGRRVNVITELRRSDPAMARAVEAEIGRRGGLGRPVDGTHTLQDYFQGADYAPENPNFPPPEQRGGQGNGQPNAQSAAANQAITGLTQAIDGITATGPDGQTAVMTALGVDPAQYALTQQYAQRADAASKATPPQPVPVPSPAEAAAATGVNARMDAIAAQLAQADEATRTRFYAELEEHGQNGFATALRGKVSTVQQSQSGAGRGGNASLTAAELESVHFNDAAMQTEYERRVNTFKQIENIPMIGPVLNMFMNMFGMGPQSYIQEHAGNIDRMSQAGLDKLPPALQADVRDNPGFQVAPPAAGAPAPGAPGADAPAATAETVNAKRDALRTAAHAIAGYDTADHSATLAPEAQRTSAVTAWKGTHNNTEPSAADITALQTALGIDPANGQLNAQTAMAMNNPATMTAYAAYTAEKDRLAQAAPAAGQGQGAAGDIAIARPASTTVDNAIKPLQQAAGLTADGRAGRATIEAMVIAGTVAQAGDNTKFQGINFSDGLDAAEINTIKTRYGADMVNAMAAVRSTSGLNLGDGVAHASEIQAVTATAAAQRQQGAPAPAR